MAGRTTTQLQNVENEVRRFTRQRPDVAYHLLAKPVENLQFRSRGNGRYEAYGCFFGKSTPARLSVYGSDSPSGQCGWAYKGEKGDVFRFVQLLHQLRTREEAIIHAGHVFSCVIKA